MIGPTPNDWARILGLPETWEIDPEVLDRKMDMSAIFDETDGTYKEVSFVGPLTAMRIGDAGISVRGRYRIDRVWYRNPRSKGMIAQTEYVF